MVGGAYPHRLFHSGRRERQPGSKDPNLTVPNEPRSPKTSQAPEISLHLNSLLTQFPLAREPPRDDHVVSRQSPREKQKNRRANRCHQPKLTVSHFVTAIWKSTRDLNACTTVSKESNQGVLLSSSFWVILES